MELARALQLISNEWARTQRGVKVCYWSRNTGGGDIIDNGLVGFVPNGETVTVYPGEGFESERCGTWTKIG